jgi:inner membrane protein
MSATERIALLSLVIFLDVVIRISSPDYALLGVLDEPAHLATGALITAAVSSATGGLPRSTWVAALCSTVLIDLDHLPKALGSNILTAGTPRPYTHSLATVFCLAVAALVLHRRPASRVFAGCVIGVSAHLLRDLGTAPVALWWPLSDRGVSIPYLVYLAVLAVAVVVARPADRPKTHTARVAAATPHQRRLPQ